LKAVEFGGAGGKALTPILKTGAKLTQDEFNSLILPTLVNLFAIQDRAIRFTLCEHLESFIKFIPEKVVNEKIFPSLATGFLDTNVYFLH
jgi:SCY1-like protein 1